MRQITAPRAAGLLAALFLAGCGASGAGADVTPVTSGSSVPSNLVGVVLVGPRCPVVTPDKPCPDTPAADVAVTFTPAAGGSAVTVRTDAQGGFSLVVPPGDYTALVVAEPAKGVMSAHPEDVTVPASGAVTVTLHGDSGIR